MCEAGDPGRGWSQGLLLLEGQHLLDELHCTVLDANFNSRTRACFHQDFSNKYRVTMKSSDEKLYPQTF